MNCKFKPLAWLLLIGLVFSSAAVASGQFTPAPGSLTGMTFANYFTTSEFIFESRLLVAVCLGVVCGLSHGSRKTNVMISTKTFVAVCLGAAAFTSVMVHVYLDNGVSNVLSGMGNIITGMGFICGAVIFKEGATVKGLTTASSLWTSAAVGMACGTAMYGVAVMVTVVLAVFHFIPNKIHEE